MLCLERVQLNKPMWFTDKHASPPEFVKGFCTAATGVWPYGLQKGNSNLSALPFSLSPTPTTAPSPLCEQM